MIALHIKNKIFKFFFVSDKVDSSVYYFIFTYFNIIEKFYNSVKPIQRYLEIKKYQQLLSFS